MKNILVMALSVFNLDDEGFAEKSTFSATFDGGISKNEPYYYQLEPSIIELKAKKDLDVVYAFVTQKAEKKEKIILEDSKTEMFCSPLEYLKNKYPEIVFQPIDIETSNPSSGIIKMVEKLRDDIDIETTLYIDSHGGFRDIQTVFQSIISLLEYEKITPSKVFGFKYDPKSNTGELVEQQSSMTINNFVSGINEFLNTGYGNGLEKYFSENGDDNGLAKLVKDISDSIVLCDMTAFENALDNMALWIKEREALPKKTYLDLFIEYFKSDYGDLLYKDKRNVVDEIEWCLKKDFLQQGLTLIESKMPGVIVGSKYFKISWNEYIYGEEFKGNTYRRNNNYRKQCLQIIDSAKQKWENKENYILKKWAENKTMKILDRDLDDEIEYMELNGDIYSNWKNTASHEDTIWGYVKIKNYEEKENRKVPVFYAVKPSINTDDNGKKIFRYFIKLHMALKNQRNQTNHSSTADRISIGYVKDAMASYIDIASYLGI